jgi:hypothetical protein
VLGISPWWPTTSLTGWLFCLPLPVLRAYVIQVSPPGEWCLPILRSTWILL